MSLAPLSWLCMSVCARYGAYRASQSVLVVVMVQLVWCFIANSKTVVGGTLSAVANFRMVLTVGLQ